MTIKILGTGCAKCIKTTEIVKEFITENNIDATVEKVEDITEIMKFNIMSTPAVVVDNEVVVKGRVPTKTILKDIFDKRNVAELICYCKQVTKHEVVKAIYNGATTLDDVKQITNACTGNQCKELNPKGVCCSADINELLPPKKTSCSCNCDC